MSIPPSRSPSYSPHSPMFPVPADLYFGGKVVERVIAHELGPDGTIRVVDRSGFVRYVEQHRVRLVMSGDEAAA